ncbi:uncharacterized protein [Pituophis catenifer annectens]|uniref:uncharacterized protein n=1 Tax=Pituophis catenifer annectens TaxID=94852 RepID=UPI0039922A0B
MALQARSNHIAGRIHPADLEFDTAAPRLTRPPVLPTAATGNTRAQGERGTESGTGPPPQANIAMTMRGTVIIAGNAVTILSVTTAGVEIAVVNEKIVTGKGGTETKKRAANINHHAASSMRVKKGKATVDTSTKRTSATKRRRRQVKMDLQKETNRTPRSSEPGLHQPRVVPLQPTFPFWVIFFVGFMSETTEVPKHEHRLGCQHGKCRTLRRGPNPAPLALSGSIGRPTPLCQILWLLMGVRFSRN